MAVATGTPDFYRTSDDLRNLRDEIQEIIKLRMTMIMDEVTKSSDQVIQSFEGRRAETLKMILDDIELAKEKAMIHVNQIDVQLKAVSKNLEELCDNGGSEMNCKEKLRTQLQDIKDTLGGYNVTQVIDLFADVPTYVLKFNCEPSISTSDCPNVTVNQPSESTPSISDTNPITVASNAHPPTEKHTEKKKYYAETNKSLTSLPRNTDIALCSRLPVVASYNVNLLASDGNHVFYTSYFENSPDLIAYCYLDGRCECDPWRYWKQARIQDMVWWDSVNAFVCATNDAVYTVTFHQDEFKIYPKIRGDWSFVRVATNGDRLWVWVNDNKDEFDGVLVYDDNFECERKINFDDGCRRRIVDNITSFCVTDQLVATIQESTVTSHTRLQVNFNGFNMVNFKSIDLGPSFGDTMIRTDGQNRLFIVTGGRILYEVSPKGSILAYFLSNNCDALTVLNSRCFIVSSKCRTLEVWQC